MEDPIDIVPPSETRAGELLWRCLPLHLTCQFGSRIVAVLVTIAPEARSWLVPHPLYSAKFSGQINCHSVLYVYSVVLSLLHWEGRHSLVLVCLKILFFYVFLGYLLVIFIFFILHWRWSNVGLDQNIYIIFYIFFWLVLFSFLSSLLFLVFVFT